jgi:hypothetical protein
LLTSIPEDTAASLSTCATRRFPAGQPQRRLIGGRVLYSQRTGTSSALLDEAALTALYEQAFTTCSRVEPTADDTASMTTCRYVSARHLKCQVGLLGFLE